MRIFCLNLLCLLGLLVVANQPCRGQTTNADFALGMEKYLQSDWAGAITNFSKSIEAAYDLYNSYSYRAYSKSMLTNSAGALADCMEVIKLYPKSAGGYVWRSQIYLNLKNVDGALADYVTAKRLEPKNHSQSLVNDIYYAFSQRASACMRADDIAGAISNRNIQMFLIPTNASLYSMRGELKLFQGHYGSAITDANTALKYNSQNYMAYCVRAWARLALNDTNGAVEDQREISMLFDNMTANKNFDPETFKVDRIFDKIMTHLTKGEVTKAVESCKSVSEKS